MKWFYPNVHISVSPGMISQGGGKGPLPEINSGHLEYVFDCIDKNTTKVGNIKAYLLAALYNAPATMDSYYRAEVNHDLYGC